MARAQRPPIPTGSDPQLEPGSGASAAAAVLRVLDPLAALDITGEADLRERLEGLKEATRRSLESRDWVLVDVAIALYDDPSVSYRGVELIDVLELPPAELAGVLEAIAAARLAGPRPGA